MRSFPRFLSLISQRSDYLPGFISRSFARLADNRSLRQKSRTCFSGTPKERMRGGTEVEIPRRQTQIFRERTSLRAAYVSCRKISNGG